MVEKYNSVADSDDILRYDENPAALVPDTPEELEKIAPPVQVKKNEVSWYTHPFLHLFEYYQYCISCKCKVIVNCFCASVINCIYSSLIIIYVFSPHILPLFCKGWVCRVSIKQNTDILLKISWYKLKRFFWHFCMLQILFAYDIMSVDKEKLLFHSEHKTKPPMLPHRGFLFLFWCGRLNTTG